MVDNLLNVDSESIQASQAESNTTARYIVQCFSDIASTNSTSLASMVIVC